MGTWRERQSAFCVWSVNHQIPKGWFSYIQQRKCQTCFYGEKCKVIMLKLHKPICFAESCFQIKGASPANQNNWKTTKVLVVHLVLMGGPCAAKFHCRIDQWHNYPAKKWWTPFNGPAKNLMFRYRMDYKTLVEDTWYSVSQYMKCLQDEQRGNKLK